MEVEGQETRRSTPAVVVAVNVSLDPVTGGCPKIFNQSPESRLQSPTSLFYDFDGGRKRSDQQEPI